MKILELRFKNLNSLYGEWIIDFTDPEYVSNGIFALTGPTGAGKSTILDAICLALYGATPRLGKITKSGNEIMSRQTGECYAEVVFQSQEGTFRCHWEQRRARKKPDGALQDQEHQIVEAQSGKPIETKKSLVGRVIEEKTGMDFERFTRSILLAQGGFDTFLKADEEQKSKILEQITGTTIYSEISRRVHERMREEREKLQRLLDQNSGIVVLDPEQEQEIQDNLLGKQKEEAELSIQSKNASQAISWLTNIEQLKSELHNLGDEQRSLDTAMQEFEPKREKLLVACKADVLEGTYATISALSEQQAEDQASLQIKEAELIELKASEHTQVLVFNAEQQRTLKAKEELNTQAPLIRKIRSLDQTIAEQAQAASESEETCSKEEKKINSDKQARVKEQKKRDEAETTLKDVQRYLEENARDEWLVSNLAGVDEQCNSLLSMQQEISEKEAEKEKVDTAVNEVKKKVYVASKRCAQKKEELETATENLQKSKNTLSEMLGGKLLREYRTEKDTLLREMAFIKKIEELENHRTKLEDGKPCPLCGSTEHPFAEGNVPVPDEIEQKIESLSSLIDKAENQEVAIQKLEQSLTVARTHLHDNEKWEAEATAELTATEKTHKEVKDAITKLQTRFEQRKQVVSQKLQPLGITEIPETEVEKLLESLKSRLKTWQEQVRQKTAIEKQIADIDSEIKRLDAVIDTQSEALKEKQEILKRLKQDILDKRSERKQLYGEKTPDVEESRLQKAIADAETAEKTARDQYDELKQQLTSVKTNIDSLKTRIEERRLELETKKTNFLQALSLAGFGDEKAFLNARLPQEERDALSALAKDLDDGQVALKAKQKDRSLRLSTECAKKVTDKSLEELQMEFEHYERSLSSLRDEIAHLKNILKEDALAKDRIKEKLAAIEAQKRECNRWDMLHALIGSSDGKKYRNFAQGLTFELMVGHANKQLVKMTDRYLLIRDGEKPLQLNVVDNYQGGEIRSTKNLSGGESFIVSLTLALGLSKMASRKVRVDSLFLDEGFGTLDEEALQTALQTLSALHQDGKLIGVISHVSALKESIRAQIAVIPLRGGRSILQGPGCTKLE